MSEKHERLAINLKMNRSISVQNVKINERILSYTKHPMIATAFW